jgi:hypothetical protein
MVAGPARAFEDGKLVDEKALEVLDRLLERFRQIIARSEW